MVTQYQIMLTVFFLIKQIIDVIIEPFTYICNLSFTLGIFPDCMKIAKVIPLFKKKEINQIFLIIDQYHYFNSSLKLWRSYLKLD